MTERAQSAVDHLFRHESGKMIAVLTKLLGLQDLQTAQDITQDTLLQALYTWRQNGLPNDPTAWLYRVARNKAIDHLRREKRFKGVRSQHAYLLEASVKDDQAAPIFFETGEIEDSQLRMIFACCHPSIPIDSQIALALKTLCGLSVSEIARAFMKDDETVAKRIYRAREKIRIENISLDLPSSTQLAARLDAVLHCLYLLFNEGYNSSHPEQLIREELCEEAMRMTYFLTQSSLTNLPKTNALLALFCFQASRLKARLNEGGNIILLMHQDRSKWFTPLIQKGFYFLEEATREEMSVYHLEAAIAYLHAIVPDFENTDWKAIHYLYSILADKHYTPVIALNKAIAALYATGAAAALTELLAIKGLDNYYLYYTALGEVFVALGQREEAKMNFEKARSLTRSSAEQQLLKEKLDSV